MRTLVTREMLDSLNSEKLIGHCYTMLGLKDEEKNALHFASAFLQYCEEYFTDKVLVEVLVRKGFQRLSDNKAPEMMIREMSLISKIKVFREMDTKGFGKELAKFLCKMNELRNQVFHAKFKDLKYGSKSLSLEETQRDLIFDFLEAVRLASGSQNAP